MNEEKEPGELLWHHSQGLGLWEGVSGTIVSDGIVYLHGLSAALDAVTGELLWSNPGFSPVLHEDAFYIWTYDGDLQAVDARTGEELWIYDTSSPAGYAYPLTVGQGAVFTSWDKERMYAIDAATGELLWRSALVEGEISSSPAVDSGVVVFGTFVPYPQVGGAGYVHGLDASTGEFLWRRDGLMVRGFSSTHCTGAIYLELSQHYQPGSARMSSLHALYPSTGEDIWQGSTGRSIQSTPVFSGTIVYVGGSTSGYEGTKRYLSALDLSTGSRLWGIEIAQLNGNTPMALSADIDGTVYVHQGSSISRIDSLTGRVLGSYQVLAGPVSPYSIGSSEGVAYLPTQRGLYAIDVSAGELLWRTELGSVFWPQVANGIVYLTSPQGVYAVKAEPPR